MARGDWPMFGSGGAAHHLRQATANSYANAIGQFLAHLHRAGMLNAEEAPADRFQVERLNGFVEELCARGVHSQEVSAQYYAEATSLHAALRHGEGVRAMRAGKMPQRRSDRRQIMRQPSNGQRRRGKG